MMKKPEKYYKRFYKEISKYQPGVHELNIGIEEKEIIRFEDTYNLNLPYYYREWLKMNNGGTLFCKHKGAVLAGIKDQTLHFGGLEIADNFDVTKREPAMPNYLFFLARTAEGDFIGYDLNHTNENDGQVIYWDSETKEITARWDNFAQWLEDEMDYWKDLVDYSGRKRSM